MTHSDPDRDAGPDQDPSSDDAVGASDEYTNAFAYPDGHTYLHTSTYPDGHTDRYTIAHPDPFAPPDGYCRAYNLPYVSFACSHGRRHRPADSSPLFLSSTFSVQAVAHAFAEPTARPPGLTHNFTCADKLSAASHATGLFFAPLLRPLHRATAPAHGRTYSDVGADHSQGGTLRYSLVAACPGAAGPSGHPDRFPIPPPALNIPM